MKQLPVFYNHSTALNNRVHMIDAEIVDQDAMFGAIENGNVGSLPGMKAAMTFASVEGISGVDGGGIDGLCIGEPVKAAGRFQYGLHRLSAAGAGIVVGGQGNGQAAIDHVFDGDFFFELHQMIGDAWQKHAYHALLVHLFDASPGEEI